MEDSASFLVEWETYVTVVIVNWDSWSNALPAVFHEFVVSDEYFDALVRLSCECHSVYGCYLGYCRPDHEEHENARERDAFEVVSVDEVPQENCWCYAVEYPAHGG